MENNYYFSILSPLQPQVVAYLQQQPTESECVFTKQPSIEDESQFVSVDECYKLRIIKDYLVEVVPNTDKIIGGLMFSLNMKYQILRIQSAFNYQEEKAFGIIIYIQEGDDEDDEMVLKLGVDIEAGYQVQKFGKCLSTKEIMEMGLYQQYVIEQRLVVTYTAIIYSAVNKQTHDKVVIKNINKQRFRETNRSIKKAMSKEYLIPFRLKHQNICSYYHIYDSPTTVTLVMESLEMNLLDFINERGFSSAIEFKETLKSILKGVQELHKHGIMHRDLKLQNIVMKEIKQDVYEPVIIDFGLAQYEGAKPYMFNKCGTPGYTAPEIIHAGQSPNYTKSCDIFSIGCVFYYFLFKKPLFEGQSLQELIKLNKEFKLNKQDPKYSLIHQKAKQLLFGLLAQDPKERITINEAIQHIFFYDEAKQQETTLSSKSEG